MSPTGRAPTSTWALARDQREGARQVPDGPASGAPAGRLARRATGLAVLATAWFAASSTVPRATQLGVVGLVAVVLAVFALDRDVRTRAVTASAALLTLLVSVPVSRLPDQRALLLLVLVAAGLLAAALLSATASVPLPRGSGLLVALLGVLAFATATGPAPGSLLTLALVAVAGLPVFLGTGALDRRGRRDVALVLVGLAAAQAVVAVVEPWLLPGHLWAPAQLGSGGQVVPLTNELLGSLERSQGTLGHPLPLGMLLVVGLALTTRLLGRGRTLPRTVLQALLLAGIVAAGARSSLLLAVVVLLLLSGRGLTPARVLTAVAAAVVGTAALLASSLDVSSTLDETSRSGSWTHRVGALRSLGRLLLWQDADRVLLGNGYGSTSRLSSEGLLQNDGFAAVDNQFVLLLAQGGLLGLGLLLTLVALALLRGEPAVRPAVLCVVATLMVFDVLLWPGATVVLCTVLGLALARSATTASGAAEVT